MFGRRQRPMLLSKLARFEGEVVILHRRREVRRYLEAISPLSSASTTNGSVST
jgi:hypothetical protein